MLKNPVLTASFSAFFRGCHRSVFSDRIHSRVSSMFPQRMLVSSSATSDDLTPQG